MTNSNNTHHDEEDTSRVEDYCVEGDTVSEGDTSDEEDIEASKTKSSIRESPSLKTKEGLELPSGSADGSGCPRAKGRKLVLVALAITAVVVISATIGGGIYASTERSATASSSMTHEEEFAKSSSIPVFSKPNADVIHSTVDDENESVPDSEANIILKDDTLGLLEEIVDYEDKDKSSDKNNNNEKESDDEEPRPTKWPDLVGMTGDEAKAQLELLYGDETYTIHILDENSPTTRDYRFDRIRILTNDEGIVTKVPHIG